MQYLSYFCIVNTNVNNMNNYKKSAIALVSACIILVSTSSCARRNATGCPIWGKTTQTQTAKKSV